MALPFGLKAPSRGTVIFTSIVGSLSGGFFASKYYAQQSEKAMCDRVAFLADRPCGVHERPRKVQVFISAPPGDSLEKSRIWFASYVKPILVAGAVDYEVQEAREPGQIEAMLRQRMIDQRREAALGEQQDGAADKNENAPVSETNDSNSASMGANPFAEPMKPVLEAQKQQQGVFDGMIAIGRPAWREVVTGISKGCTVSLAQAAKEEAEREAAAKQKALDDAKAKEAKEVKEAKETVTTETMEGTMEAVVEESSNNEQEMPLQQQEEDPAPPSTDASLMSDEMATTDDVSAPLDARDAFGLPAKLSPVIYVPQENIIGWTNIPYRIYMWVMDYQRIERFGNYAVAAVLNETRPLEIGDLDVGKHEMKYWIGDDEAKDARNNDTPIQIDDRVRQALKTYTSN
ncbi:mitochondrial import inner membrane translocase subunit Tim54 [Gongronella butleri]|nr:mitochondrial import inner membrane translocase subunit Tim54 [Gongronella butleri]